MGQALVVEHKGPDPRTEGPSRWSALVGRLVQDRRVKRHGIAHGVDAGEAEQVADPAGRTSPPAEPEDPRPRVGHVLVRRYLRQRDLARASWPGVDRGSLTLEAVIVAPVLLMFLALIIAAGRIMIAGGSIEAAARDAARQASIARDPATARSNAMSSAQAALQQEGLRCKPQVSVDTSGFARPIGTQASVLVQVRCTVALSDLVVVGMPGSHTLSASFRSPIDPFRGR